MMINKFRAGSFYTACLFLILLAMDGNKENKLQEKALILSTDNGKDSPEVDQFLFDNNLNEEEMDFSDDDEKESD